MQPNPEEPSDKESRAYEASRRAEWIAYPYEHFDRHLAEMRHRRMESVVDDFGAYFRNVKRLNGFFDEFYDQPESIRNQWSFEKAMEHLERHFDSYDTEPFGEVRDGELFLSEALQRAVHWYYAVLPREDWRHDDDSVGRIKSRALEWLSTHPKK